MLIDTILRGVAADVPTAERKKRMKRADFRLASVVDHLLSPFATCFCFVQSRAPFLEFYRIDVSSDYKYFMPVTKIRNRLLRLFFLSFSRS